jgi:hypothetical protein
MCNTATFARNAHLSTLATEGKGPRYVDWLKIRLKCFSAFIIRKFGSLSVTE